MKLRNKITLLTTAVILCVAILTIIPIRGVIINAFRVELEKKAASIAGSLSERVADHILLKDNYQVTEALHAILKRENDLQYIFVTDEKGKIFAHTFQNGFPPDVLTWNPLNGEQKNVQLLDTEKGFIRDVGVNIFSNTKAELHVGIREDSLESTLLRMRNITIPIIITAIFLGIIASFFVSRLITEPLDKFVDFTEILGSGDFNRRVDISSRDEIGYLAHSFNRLSMELKAAKEKIEEAYTYTHMLQAEKLSSVGQISAGLAHELKNPVAALKMLFQAFKEQPDMTREDAEIIHGEIEKIDKILTQFLSFVRQKDFQSSELHMGRLIDRVLSLTTFDIQNSHIMVKKDVVDDLPPIQGDRALLEQVFLNLVINSIQAMPNGGEIRISGKTDNGFIEVMIWDQGSGIPDKLRSKIFDPFFTTKQNGTGLGLSIAYNIIKTHGGKLYFNTSEKGGTVFTVKLPRGKENG
jgi:signal transduction histidine kinase